MSAEVRTCADSHLQSTVCKHSHLVQLHINHSRSLDPSQAIASSTSSATDVTSGTDNELESAEYFIDILKSSCDSSLNTQKRSISDALYELQSSLILPIVF